jgi:hypothetical protein
MRKRFFLGILLSISTLSGCTEEEIANFFGGEKNQITVSGKTRNIDDTAEPDVLIEGIYVTAGSTSNPSISSDNDGEFSLELTENESFYLRASKNGFVSKGTKDTSLDSDKTDVIIEMLTETEVQNIIDMAFPSAPQLFNHAWLIVNVVTGTGDEANGHEVVPAAVPAGAVYTSCTGANSGAAETTGAPCPDDRPAPMYIAYYDDSGDITATVDNESQTASIRIGEITELTFELP